MKLWNENSKPLSPEEKEKIRKERAKQIVTFGSFGGHCHISAKESLALEDGTPISVILSRRIKI